MAIDDAQETEVSFLSAFGSDGTLAATAFATWNHNAGTPTYSSTSHAHKWAGTTAGTAGGTVTYAFAANITGTQQAAFQAGLQLWQDESDISFVQAAPGSTPNFQFLTNDNRTSAFTAHFAPHSVGTTTVAAPQSYTSNGTTNLPNISIDVDNNGFGTFQNNFSDLGRSFSTLVHEEGHMMGLGHAGPYNVGTGSPTPNALYQLTAYDSRQYSNMSYNQPNNADGTVNTSGAQYDPSIDTANWGHDQAVTPMELDILSAQRLYGAPTSGALTQSQTFGFNCTITDATSTFFNFGTYNGAAGQAPVLTIYDSAATGSTLDLSGYATASVVDLNQGAFSSVDGLTSNICIAYDTKIDTAIGGGGDDVFSINADADVIDGGAGTNTVDFTGALSSYAIASSAGGVVTVTDTSTGVVDTLSDIQVLDFADQSVMVCYCSGTTICTARGDVVVEDLRIGDLVVAVSGARRPIRWLGHRTIDCRSSATRSEVWPVRIIAGSFGGGLPKRDLLLSQGHPVLVGDHLVPIMCLINGTSIARVPVDQVTYWHVELDRHDILLAEGLPAESFLDYGNRPWFALDAQSCAADHDLMNPDFVPPGLGARCRPVAVDGPIVDAERRRLDMLFSTRLDAASHWPDPEANLTSLLV